MSKCQVCGFALSDGHLASCPQCGESTSAVGTGTEGKDLKKTVPDSGSLGFAMTNHTVLGRQAGGEGGTGSSASTSCTSCGYPLREGSLTCPGCGSATGSATGEESASVSADRPAPVPPAAVRPATRRLDDFQAGPGRPSIRLVPINRPERESLESDQQEWVLSRKDIDPSDDSISAQAHVEIRRDPDTGQWLLHNAGSNKALFVQVQGDLPLSQDMVILIGQHRLYRVSLDEGK